MSLALHVVRHAIAEPRSPQRDDADRPLTDEGRRRFRKVVRGLGRLGVRLDRLEHSPWRRAVQTAELLAPLVEGPVAVNGLLARPPSSELLAGLGPGRVGIVGHEPWLSETVAWLCTGDPGHGAAFELKKGSVAILAGNPRPGGMVLESLLPPRALRRLG